MVKNRTGKANKTFKCRVIADAAKSSGSKVLESVSDIFVTIQHGQFILRVDEGLLAQLQDIQTLGLRLEVPYSLAADLRRFAMFDQFGRVQSGLTFCTYYVNWFKSTESESTSAARRSGKMVLRSVVSIDGDVINQVVQDCLQHPDCLQITAAHYWIMNQLLDGLRFNLKLPATLVAGASTIAVNLVFLRQLLQMSAWSWVQLIGVPIASWLLWRWLLPNARQWAIRQLLFPNAFVRGVTKRFWG